MLEAVIPTHLAGTEKCLLSEGPLWDAERNRLFWTDITAGKIYSFDPSTQEQEIVYEGESVGGFTLQADGDLLLFRVKDIVLLKPSGETEKVRDFSDAGMTRFNDVIADPAGRVFAGTIGKNPEAGLYRMDLDGEITKLFSGSACSNGMGFSPDLKKFYWTCTTRRQIHEFKFDVATGQLSDQKVFYFAEANEGLPDGLTVDSEGCIWSARWGGSMLVRHAPDGTVLGRIHFPAANISSACFAGQDLDEIFVTAAQDVKNPAPHLKGVFRLRAGFQGKTEFRSRIKIPGPV